MLHQNCSIISNLFSCFFCFKLWHLGSERQHFIYENRMKETGPFCFQQQHPVCETVASSYTEKRSGPRQLRSSPAKGSKVHSGGICCPLAIINSGNQTLAVLWLLWFRHQLLVTLSSNWTFSTNADTPGIVLLPSPVRVKRSWDPPGGHGGP